MTTQRKFNCRTKLHTLLLFLIVVNAKLLSAQARVHCALAKEKKTMFLNTKTGAIKDNKEQQYDKSVGENDNDGNDIIEITARQCLCSRKTSNEYCAILNGENRCSVHRWTSDPNLETICYKKTKLENFLQFIYLPSMLLLGIVIIMPFSTVAGKNSVEYLLSFCFPCIRRRHVNRVIQQEMEAITEHIAIESILDCDDGMVEQTVLKLRTKFLNLDHQDQGRHHDKQNHDPEGISSDLNSVEVSCLICMAGIKEGERIADLSCNHNFHTDCIKEWIKRRNVCPLCNSQVAECETILVPNDELGANDEIDEEARNQFDRLTAFYRLRTSRRLRSSYR